jgi:diaminobutyrate-2-oxoglutarate transaminase
MTDIAVVRPPSIDRAQSDELDALVTEPDASDVFDRRESNVRSYCRSFPATFNRAKGSMLYDADGRGYLDFLAGAGALNYGHNHDTIKSAMLDYLAADGVLHGLDLHTTAKAAFLEAFEQRILEPRGLDYKVQFTGPTGTNAVEAAFKIARKATGRTGIFSFMGGYHGHSLGSLAATANREHRAAAGVGLSDVTFMPFPFGAMAGIDTLDYLEAVLTDSHSGIELPAAVIVETVQAEGGVIVAPTSWLQRLRTICDDYGIVLIIDDIQAGCGRTGPFFSFERAQIVPDIITLSKSISGCGLPMALVLIKPELDVWAPAEHTGTFRGNQLAFVAATAALAVFSDEWLTARTLVNEAAIRRRLIGDVGSLDPRIELRGIGMIWGLDLAGIDPTGALAKLVSMQCFANGLIVERVGRHDTVLKILPPLTITTDDLDRGLRILASAVKGCLDSWIG